MSSMYYLRIYCYVVCTLVIFYQLLNLFLLHKFSKKNIKIPKVLPEFLINWLKSIKLLSSHSESIKDIKSSSYKQILFYLLLIFFISIIF